MSVETEKVYTSIQEIDADLEKEFVVSAAADAEDSNQEEDTKEVNEVESEETAAEVESEQEVNELEEKADTTEPIKETKPSKDEQKDYNFAKLRSEKEAAEKQLLEQAALMKKLAEASGYNSVEEYKQVLENRLIEEEAKKQGVSPKMYKELSEAKSKVQKLEAEKLELDNRIKLEAFSKEIANVVGSYGLSEDTGDEIVKRFAELGYTLETLLSVPHPEILIKGVIADKLNEKSTKEQANKAKAENVDTKTIPSAKVEVKSIEQLIDDEMRTYAKSRGIKYVE